MGGNGEPADFLPGAMLFWVPCFPPREACERPPAVRTGFPIRRGPFAVLERWKRKLFCIHPLRNRRGAAAGPPRCANPTSFPALFLAPHTIPFPFANPP